MASFMPICRRIEPKSSYSGNPIRLLLCCKMYQYSSFVAQKQEQKSTFEPRTKHKFSAPVNSSLLCTSIYHFPGPLFLLGPSTATTKKYFCNLTKTCGESAIEKKAEKY